MKNGVGLQTLKGQTIVWQTEMLQRDLISIQSLRLPQVTKD